jgi:hypothetical protein
MNLVTLPYYRFFRQNTLTPIRSIIKSLEHGREDDNASRMFAAWQDRKLLELHFVQVAVSERDAPYLPLPRDSFLPEVL